jgi:hypothetical protein
VAKVKHGREISAGGQKRTAGAKGVAAKKAVVPKPGRKTAAVKVAKTVNAGTKSAARKGKRPATVVPRKATPPERVVRIRALDPYEKCGPDTSVLHLFRVDEKLDGSVATHLVFFDRHGWYCEHGRGCRAVDDVKKLGKSLGRTI